MGLIKEFKDFAIKGNAVDMAVGIVIGAAFTGVVNSLVADVMMPPLGMVTGGVDFADKLFVLQAKTDARPEVALTYGKFINTIINFVIVAFALFMVVKAMNTLKRKEEAAPAAPAEPPQDVKLLTEIRDLLKTR
ncbi:MAG: large-conductance mechanosensitive channel protein MscL [Phycisphaerales bacterium]|nr:large-conductance mechanosensitive channel protein MscL [Phycisphaerales bacterium]